MHGCFESAADLARYNSRPSEFFAELHAMRKAFAQSLPSAVTFDVGGRTLGDSSFKSRCRNPNSVRDV